MNDELFVETGPEGGHKLRVGGLTLLERVLFLASREGVRRARVRAEPLPLRADLPVEVTWIADDAAPPEGARVVRGDEVSGIRVVDRRSAKRLERELCLALAKSHQGLVDGLLNWRLSTPITRLLANTPITPNQVTFVSFAVGVTGAGLLLLRTPWAIGVGGGLLQLQSVLDSCDGELARLRYQGSKLGQWLDNVTDDVLDVAFIACAGFALGPPWQWVTLVASLARALAQVGVYHEVYRRHGTGDVYKFRIWYEKDVGTSDEVYDKKKLATWGRSLGRRDTYVFAWAVLCAFGQLQVVCVWGIVLAAAISGFFALHLVFREPLPRRSMS